MRDNNLTYADVKRLVTDGDKEWSNGPTWDQHCSVLALRNIPTDPARPQQLRAVRKGELGYIRRPPEPQKNRPLPVVEFQKSGAFDVRQNVDVETVQFLIDHWGWRLADGEGPPVVDSDDDRL